LGRYYRFFAVDHQFSSFLAGDFPSSLDPSPARSLLRSSRLL
jgi:hypothetical protein